VETTGGVVAPLHIQPPLPTQKNSKIFVTSAKIAEKDWSDGWTNAATYKIGDQNYLFLYKKDKNGIVHIHKVGACDKTGGKCHGALIDDRNWSNGWTHTTPYTVGNKHFLLLLKEDTGDIHIHKINADGKIGQRIYDKKWTEDWTNATFYYDENNNTYLLLLKESGTVHIHKMKTNGKVGTSLKDSTWSEGWTHTRYYRAGANHYLMLYKEDSGRVHLHKINLSGESGNYNLDKKRLRDWEDDWELIDFFYVDEHTYVFLAKQEGLFSGSTKAEVYNINKDGTRGSKIRKYDWTSGWSSVVHYNVGDKVQRFLIKESNGIAHYDKIFIADAYTEIPNQGRVRVMQHRAAPRETGSRGDLDIPLENTIDGMKLTIDLAENAGLEFDVKAAGGKWIVCHDPNNCDTEDHPTLKKYLEVAAPLIKSRDRTLWLEMKNREGNGHSYAEIKEMIHNLGLQKHIIIVSFHADILDAFAQLGHKIGLFVHLGENYPRGNESCDNRWYSIKKGIKWFNDHKNNNNIGNLDMRLILRWRACDDDKRPEADNLLAFFNGLEYDLDIASTNGDKLQLWFTGLGSTILGSDSDASAANDLQRAISAKQANSEPNELESLITLSDNPHAILTNWYKNFPQVLE
jgi:hypothetical protein